MASVWFRAHRLNQLHVALPSSLLSSHDLTDQDSSLSPCRSEASTASLADVSACIVKTWSPHSQSFPTLRDLICKGVHLSSWHDLRAVLPLYWNAKFRRILNAGEGPPTLQSTVIPAWNYAPQLLGKVTPIFSPLVNAARKWKSKKKLSSQMCKTPWGRKSPQWFQRWKITNKMICFNIKTPCKCMIHVCLGKISLLLQNAFKV